MINKIKNTITNKYYKYQPSEFMPIFIEGELANKKEFHWYKAKRAAGHVHWYIKALRYEIKQAQQ
jgi:hypothetical protein